ncbi:MAG: hypothetical protein RLZZ488_850 [Pseudomonadota bacterium]|jgi:hypothetical protein
MMRAVFRNRYRSCEWNVASSALSSISVYLSRRSVTRAALIQGLKHSKSNQLKEIARTASLPLAPGKRVNITPDAEYPVPTNFRLVSFDSLTQIVHGCVTTLLSPQFTAFDVRFWRKSFSNLYQVERWMRQQSAQSRVQALFLSGFVPVVSLLFCLFSHERFLANVELPQGRIILTVAVMLYFLGLAGVLMLMDRSHGFVRQHRGLNDAGGRLDFIQSLIASAATLRTKRERLIFASRHSGCVRGDEFARRLSCAMSLPDTNFCPSDHASFHYLESVRTSLLYSPQSAEHWLSREHEGAFEDFRAESAQRAALLSLRLLFPMATFFLPALFLVLALCGFSLGGDTLN